MTERWFAHPRLHHRTFALVHRCAEALALIGAVVLVGLALLNHGAARYHSTQARDA